MFATFRGREYHAPNTGGYLKVRDARGNFNQVLPPRGSGAAPMIDPHTTSEQLAEQIAKLAWRYNL